MGSETARSARDEHGAAPRVRLAGAPISWGVCEVPGWGLQLPPERVLGEMAGLGLTATELGPLGWLPREPGALRERLDAHRLALVGGFVPLVLHEPALGDARAAAEDAARGLAAAGAEVFVCALVADSAWSAPPALDDGDLAAVVRNLAAIEELVAAHGLTLMGATQEGLFQPLGRGDARIAEVLAQLEAHGYERWLVLEQDAALTGEEPPVGSGPVLDVQASIEFVRERAPGRGRGA